MISKQEVSALKDYLQTNDESEPKIARSFLEDVISVFKELEEYRNIGTADECRDAMEKKKAKKPIILDEQSTKSDGRLYVAKYFKCPSCESTSTYFGGLPNNCHNCGQAILQKSEVIE